MKRIYTLVTVILAISVGIAFSAGKNITENDLKSYHTGMECIDCHDSKKPTTPAIDAKCESCHGTPEEVAELTKDLRRNPHNSIHYETSAPCTVCHKEHQKSEVLCYTCHSFRFENFKE